MNDESIFAQQQDSEKWTVINFVTCNPYIQSYANVLDLTLSDFAELWVINSSPDNVRTAVNYGSIAPGTGRLTKQPVPNTDVFFFAGTFQLFQ